MTDYSSLIGSWCHVTPFFYHVTRQPVNTSLHILQVLTGCKLRADCLYKKLFSESAHSDILYSVLFLTFCPFQLLTMSKRSLPFSYLEADCKVLNYSPTDLGRQSNVYWILYRSKSPFRQLLHFEIEKKITSFWNRKENAFPSFIIRLFFRLHPELLS